MLQDSLGTVCVKP